MNVPKNIEFPEVTSAQINVALLADKLNQTLEFLREQYPENKNAFKVIETNLQRDESNLKPGVRVLANGRYMMDGKFIKKEQATV